jgi:hypothetical protein
LEQNLINQDMKKVLELGAICEYPDTIWLMKLFARCDVSNKEETRQVFLGCEGDLRAVYFTASLVGSLD